MTTEPAEISRKVARFLDRTAPTEAPVVPINDGGADIDHADDPLAVFIDWRKFWAQDHASADWLYEPVIARGRGHALFAQHKVGKSLLMLWLALQMIRQGVAVIYLDFEMTDDDVYERLEDMGCDADTDLLRLHYWLLPSLPPLNTAEGGAELHRIVDAVREAHPDREVFVVIDTTIRAVEGEENSADTINDFYLYAGLGLKQRGVGWARLDHAGKDPTRGQRGTSAKGDDVDVVWRLVEVEGGLELRRERNRIVWVPETVTLRKLDEPLRFEPVETSWPPGTLETANTLDQLGVPLDASWRTAQKALKDAGKGKRVTVIRAALRHRRMTAENLGTRSWTRPSAAEAGSAPGPVTPEAA